MARGRRGQHSGEDQRTDSILLPVPVYELQKPLLFDTRGPSLMQVNGTEHEKKADDQARGHEGSPTANAHVSPLRGASGPALCPADTIPLVSLATILAPCQARKE